MLRSLALRASLWSSVCGHCDRKLGSVVWRPRPQGMSRLSSTAPSPRVLLLRAVTPEYAGARGSDAARSAAAQWRCCFRIHPFTSGTVVAAARAAAALPAAPDALRCKEQERSRRRRREKGWRTAGGAAEAQHEPLCTVRTEDLPAAAALPLRRLRRQHCAGDFRARRCAPRTHARRMH